MKKQNKLRINSESDEEMKVGNLDDLNKLLEEIQDWDMKNNEASHQKTEHYKFTDISRNRAKTIELSYNKNGQLDLQNLQSEIDSCKDEYIKVRVPSDVDISYLLIDTDRNNNSECRRRERAKTIAEYFV